LYVANHLRTVGREKNGYSVSVVNVGLTCCVLDLTMKQKPMCVTTVRVMILLMIRLRSITCRDACFVFSSIIILKGEHFRSTVGISA